MEYTSDQIESLVNDIKGTTGFLAKVLFAGFNLVLIIVLGVILVSNLAIH